MLINEIICTVYFNRCMWLLIPYYFDSLYFFAWKWCYRRMATDSEMADMFTPKCDDFSWKVLSKIYRNRLLLLSITLPLHHTFDILFSLYLNNSFSLGVDPISSSRINVLSVLFCLRYSTTQYMVISLSTRCVWLSSTHPSFSDCETSSS